jgi:DNA-binding response OmpR family regulator
VDGLRVGITPGTLAMAAFGHDIPDDSTAIRLHVLRIRRRIGAYGATIETVRGVGYRYQLEAAG